MNAAKKRIFYVWIVVIGGILSVYFLNPHNFQAQNIQQIFSDNLFLSISIYFILGTLRGMTLLPSTPMVLAGALVFPPMLLYVVNLLCIFTSSTIVYYWSGYLGFDEYFNRKYPDQLEQLKHVLQKREVYFIALWGFFPAVPTDMICYVSEILKIKLWKCLLGVALGEGIICAIYIFGGNSILQLLT